jgi:succinate dehydrogenase flavin-adding protein (antitoxin of CptAB toxin-antitoxin module)
MEDEKSLKYQLLSRGTREGALLFEAFLGSHGSALTVEVVQVLRILLQYPDQDIIGWVVGGIPKPEWLKDSLLHKIRMSLRTDSKG